MPLHNSTNLNQNAAIFLTSTLVELCPAARACPGTQGGRILSQPSFCFIQVAAQLSNQLLVPGFFNPHLEGVILLGQLIYFNCMAFAQVRNELILLVLGCFERRQAEKYKPRRRGFFNDGGDFLSRF